MSCDVFCQSEALQLLQNKRVWFFGDSNMRSMYKDFVWLLEHGTLISQRSLQCKNEETHANDRKLTDSLLHSGRNYCEEREYKKGDVSCLFVFVTKHNSDSFRLRFENAKSGALPDVVLLNSCVWDLTRWGPEGVAEYKKNLMATLKFLNERAPSHCLVLFATTLPLSSECQGGFLRKEVEFLRYVLPWHILEANKFTADMSKLFGFDVIDLHYHMRFMLDQWMSDGIHWTPLAYRMITNFLLTHIALSFDSRLPKVYPLDANSLLGTEKNRSSEIPSKKQNCVSMVSNNSRRNANTKGIFYKRNNDSRMRFTNFRNEGVFNNVNGEADRLFREAFDFSQDFLSHFGFLMNNWSPQLQ